ncbi:signal peptidase II [Thiogranum longum]|uniref:Lipoprotein signal peptidase n=1 Tax=Thiogranum longum TaxID=1537524 RepID=A0A4R1HPE5_9GAMM|nr:signal peptidase II [Thiogranum longum]TCK19152.1 signal peptidase II [Thiogranum longum]
MKKWLALALLVVVLDQLTKSLAVNVLTYAEPLAVFPSFNLTLLYNRGAAFSFLSDASGWQRWFFVVVSAGAAVFLTLWLRRLKQDQVLLSVALALVLGGAVGNLIDRLWLGHVVDFIQIYYKQYYWPAFNIADSAISVGAVLLIWDSLFARRESD